MTAIRKASEVAEDIDSGGDTEANRHFITDDRMRIVERLRAISRDCFVRGTQADADIQWMASELEKEITDAAK